MQPTFDMLCLTCPCHHRNDQLSASWQDYLGTNHGLQKLYIIFGECIGSTFGHLRNTGISPSTVLPRPTKYTVKLGNTNKWRLYKPVTHGLEMLPLARNVTTG